MLDEKEPLASFENLRVEFDTKDGKVVAVNYSGIIEYGQSFAIASNLADNVTNLLLSGENFMLLQMRS